MIQFINRFQKLLERLCVAERDEICRRAAQILGPDDTRANVIQSPKRFTPTPYELCCTLEGLTEGACLHEEFLVTSLVWYMQTVFEKQAELSDRQMRARLMKRDGNSKSTSRYFKRRIARTLRKLYEDLLSPEISDLDAESSASPEPAVPPPIWKWTEWETPLQDLSLPRPRARKRKSQRHVDENPELMNLPPWEW